MTINTPTGEDKGKTPVRLTLKDVCVLRIKDFCFFGSAFIQLSQVTRRGDAYQNVSAGFLTAPCEAFAQPLLTYPPLLDGENDQRFVTIYGASGGKS